MSIWTCDRSRRIRRGGLAATLALSLSGCLGGVAPNTAAPNTAAQNTAAQNTAAQTGGAAFGAASFAAQRVLNGASLFEAAVILRPPPGYCVDGDSLRARGPAFALIASCPLLLGGAPATVAPLVIIVTGQAYAGPLPDARALAGLVGATTILDTQSAEGLTLVHLQGGTPGPLADGDPRHWRAMLLVNGHLLSLALFAPEGSVQAGQAGQLLIRAMADATRAASPTGAADAPPETPRPAPLAPPLARAPAPAAGNPSGHPATARTKDAGTPSAGLVLPGKTG